LQDSEPEGKFLLPSVLPCSAAIEGGASILATSQAYNTIHPAIVGATRATRVGTGLATARPACSANFAGAAAIDDTTTSAARGGTSLPTSRPTCSASAACVAAICGATNPGSADRLESFAGASSPPRFRTPLTPPAIVKLPTSCRECHCNSHDIAYRHCIKCYFKENGYPSYYQEM
jgi:hypothetical protein